MIPGPDLYYKCSYCENIITGESFISGNTFGAKRYSDGRVIAPMLPEYPRVVCCRKCHNITWLRESCEVSSPKDYKLHNEMLPRRKRFKTAQRARFLRPSQYEHALSLKYYETREEEMYLRKWYWWSINDTLREGCNRSLQYTDYEQILFQLEYENLEPSNSETDDIMLDIKSVSKKYYEKEDFVDNLKKLILMLKEDIKEFSKPENKEECTDIIVNNTFMIAELYRNLGNFSECKKTLKEIKNPDLLWLKEIFEEECDKENRFVFMIRRNES